MEREAEGAGGVGSKLLAATLWTNVAAFRRKNGKEDRRLKKR